MEFYPPNESNFSIRLLRMVILIALVFVLSKMLYEANQLDYFPKYVNDLIFVFSCICIGWLFRIKNSWNYSKQGLIVSANANLFGFVFIVAKVNGVNKYQFRLWNPDSHSFTIKSDFAIKICFKPTEKVVVGGCHVLCKNQEIKPN